MLNNLILASKSKVRKEILRKHKIFCDIVPSNVDEDMIKESLLNEKASPEIISKNLAELKANKISSKIKEKIIPNVVIIAMTEHKIRSLILLLSTACRA